MIRRFAAGVALATGLALSLTGCLGEDGGKAGGAEGNADLTAMQVLAKAAENTDGADSFKAAVSMRASTEDGELAMKGEMEQRTKPDYAYKMSFSEMTIAGRSVGAGEQVMVGGDLYVKLPAGVTGGASTGKPWMKMSMEELGKRSGINFDDLLQQSQQMDPTQTAKMLTASNDVVEVGKEKVDGVETTHYNGTYSTDDAAAKLDPEQQRLYSKGITEAGMETMHFDLWVDGQQMPRQMVLKSPETASTSTQVTVKIRDYGEPVEVAAPPADQVTDFGELMRGLQGLQGGGVPGA